jgi:hypothetical protein
VRRIIVLTPSAVRWPCRDKGGLEDSAAPCLGCPMPMPLSSPAEPRFSATDIGNGPIGREHLEGGVTPSRSLTSEPAELPGDCHFGLIRAGSCASIGRYLHKGILAITRVGPVQYQPRGSAWPSACRSHTRRHPPSQLSQLSAKGHDQSLSVSIRERHLKSPPLLTYQPAVLSTWRAPTLSFIAERERHHRPSPKGEHAGHPRADR